MCRIKYIDFTIWNSITLAEFKNQIKLVETQVFLQYVYKIAMGCSWPKTL